MPCVLGLCGQRAWSCTIPHVLNLYTKPCAQNARETLENAIRMVEQHPAWDAHVVYGDTDSLFVQLPGRCALCGVHLAQSTHLDDHAWMVLLFIPLAAEYMRAASLFGSGQDFA